MADFLFLNDGAHLNPNSSENGPFFSMILVVYLGHGIFFPIFVAVFFLSPNQFFGRGLKLPTTRENTSEEPWCASVVARVIFVLGLRHRSASRGPCERMPSRTDSTIAPPKNSGFL